MDDRELAERCLASDQSAIRMFVERFQGLVFTICVRRLRNLEDAEDVAQQSMIRAIRYLSHWDQKRPLKPWISIIAVNRCRTHLQERERRIQTCVNSTETIRQEFPVRNLELLEEIERALGHLRQEYQDCFRLFYLKELSLASIAETMNRPEGTIKTWLHRARREVASILKERGVVTEDGYELP